jgi:hypothetical protein
MDSKNNAPVAANQLHIASHQLPGSDGSGVIMLTDHSHFSSCSIL